MFNTPGLTKETHPLLRQSAKSALLGCGYSLGWASFAAQLLTGFLGADPIMYGVEFAAQLGLTAEFVERWMEDPERVEKMLDIPHNCSNDELAVHCAVADTIIQRYRGTSVPVVRLWKTFDGLIGKVLTQDKSLKAFGGKDQHVVKCLTFREGEIILPNGMSLRYPDIVGKPSDRGWTEWTYGPDNKKLYGGKLTENVVQAVARIVMTDGMLRIQKRYPCKLTVHDEAVALIPEHEAEEGLAYMKACMLKEPKYLPGIPLDVTGSTAQRYGDSK
jgi:DNA polymerase